MKLAMAKKDVQTRLQRLLAFMVSFIDQADPRFSKVFNNIDFGYRRITIERPLRLNFQRNTERIERIK